jgi:hypothetical protein
MACMNHYTFRDSAEVKYRPIATDGTPDSFSCFSFSNHWLATSNLFCLPSDVLVAFLLR